jgi:hypothetical protein
MNLWDLLRNEEENNDGYNNYIINTWKPAQMFYDIFMWSDERESEEQIH